jgi:hypothetical protein
MFKLSYICSPFRYQSVSIQRRALDFLVLVRLDECEANKIRDYEKEVHFGSSLSHSNMSGLQV